MPGRTIPHINDGYYHIFNRGSDKRNIFLQRRDYTRFLQTVRYYQFSGPKPKFSDLTKRKLFAFIPAPGAKLVEIICYCLMPNHFHFLVRQIKDNGVAIFVSQLTNSYTKYFNTKYNRVGALLQGTFKSCMIENDEHLLHVSRYIHLNPVVADLVKSLKDYEWSSYVEYIRAKGSLCSITDVLSFFPNPEKYSQFLEDQIEYAQSLDLIKHQVFDEL